MNAFELSLFERPKIDFLTILPIKFLNENPAFIFFIIGHIFRSYKFSTFRAKPLGSQFLLLTYVKLNSLSMLSVSEQPDRAWPSNIYMYLYIKIVCKKWEYEENLP